MLKWSFFIDCAFRAISERANERARRSFFVVKFHANLFNGSLAIANKREDELFAIRQCIYARTYVRVARIYDSRRPHVRRTRSLCHTMAKNIKLILYLVRSYLFPSLSISVFSRDNRAILNRHEAGNFFPVPRDCRPRRGPAKIPESIFSNIGRRLIFANYIRARKRERGRELRARDRFVSPIGSFSARARASL